MPTTIHITLVLAIISNQEMIHLKYKGGPGLSPVGEENNFFSILLGSVARAMEIKLIKENLARGKQS